MKLLCETTVQYRGTDTGGRVGGGGPGGRAQKSTLALGAHPPNADHAELFLILFTTANKTGTRYKVRDNLERVFTKFLAQGKATISLRQPAHDLQIRCDAVQLKCFLQALRLGLEGKRANGAVGLTTLATVAIPSSAHPVTKLVVRSRGDYPLRGLPKTLHTLQVNGIQRARFDSQILFLKHLTTLNLNDNVITVLPKQLGQMRLQVLDMGANRLGESGPDGWHWLNGQPLQETLQSLTLSGNGLRSFPFGLVRMRRLTLLKLDDNSIERLPFALRRLKSLKFLHLANNRLTSLPSTITCNTYKTIDLSGNPFEISAEPDSCAEELAQQMAAIRTVPPLCEIVARVVTAKRLPYNARTLPGTLIDLLEEAPVCSCGVLCFAATVMPRSQRVQLRTEHVIYHGSGGSGVSSIRCDATYCSRRCLAKYAIR